MALLWKPGIVTGEGLTPFGSARAMVPHNLELRGLYYREILENCFQNTNLPLCQTRCTQQMPTRLYPDVLVVLGADLTQLEGGSHLTVQLVLLLRHLYMVLLRVLDQETQVRIDRPPVRVFETETRGCKCSNRVITQVRVDRPTVRVFETETRGCKCSYRVITQVRVDRPAVRVFETETRGCKCSYRVITQVRVDRPTVRVFETETHRM